MRTKIPHFFHVSLNTNHQLTDGIILLRPPQIQDVPDLCQAIRESMAELQPWMDWATPSYDLDSAQRWFEFTRLTWQHASAFHFVIIDSGTGQYLGNCGIDGIDEKKQLCNLGYWVRTSQTGKGIASRATRLAARFAFETMTLQRIEIVIANDNLASQRVAQKAGAHFECLIKDGMVVRATMHDAAIYTFSPADFAG